MRGEVLQPAASPARAAPRSEAAISTHGQGELPPGEGCVHSSESAQAFLSLNSQRWSGPCCPWSTSPILLAASITRAVLTPRTSAVQAPPACELRVRRIGLRLDRGPARSRLAAQAAKKRRSCSLEGCCESGGRCRSLARKTPPKGAFAESRTKRGARIALEPTIHTQGIKKMIAIVVNATPPACAAPMHHSE